MKTSRFACIVTVLFALLPSVVWAGDADGKLNLRLPVGQPEVFERVEIAVEGVPAAANPFDPEVDRPRPGGDAAVRAEAACSRLLSA